MPVNEVATNKEKWELQSNIKTFITLLIEIITFLSSALSLVITDIKLQLWCILQRVPMFQFSGGIWHY